ncbi:TetR/AcrR family transcriptional regulator [Burkholderia pseudomallei]|nr:TetR/AcrR family transcriptional regulator [Burkholderia pseudomallei]
MTITHEKNELARRRARTKVLGKAAELFGRYGFHAVSVRQITREAGVAFQSMYNNFEGRETLAREVLEWRHRGVIEELTARIAAVEGVDAKLKTIFDWHEAWFTSEVFSGCLFERAIAEYGTSEPDVSEVAVRHKKALLTLLEGVLQSEFDASETKRLASVVLMLVDGSTAHARAFRDPRMARQAWRATQALLTEARQRSSH